MKILVEFRDGCGVCGIVPGIVAVAGTSWIDGYIHPGELVDLGRAVTLGHIKTKLVGSEYVGWQ